MRELSLYARACVWIEANKKTFGEEQPSECLSSSSFSSSSSSSRTVAISWPESHQERAVVVKNASFVRETRNHLAGIWAQWNVLAPYSRENAGRRRNDYTKSSWWWVWEQERKKERKKGDVEERSKRFPFCCCWMHHDEAFSSSALPTSSFE